jgi:cytochrome oxidase Cu insertion factor (SCO1/SenC/PrrC family)
MTIAYTLFVVAVFVTALAVVYVFVVLERRNSSPARHRPMADRYQAATGMTYPDRHGNTTRLYDYENEDAA